MALAKVSKAMSSLTEGGIILLETDPSRILDVNLSAIKAITKKGYYGVILTASRPYNNLISVYKKQKVAMDHLFFIDCISKSQSMDLKEHEDVIFLESAAALTTISIAVNKALESMQGKRFLFIDSLQTMLIYNEPQIFARFIHNLLTKIRLHEINGILIAQKKEMNKQVRAEIAQLCDKILDC